MRILASVLIAFLLVGCSPDYVKNALSGMKPTLERVAIEATTPAPLAHEAVNGVRVIEKLELTEGKGSQPLDLNNDAQVDAFCQARDTQYQLQQALKAVLGRLFPWFNVTLPGGVGGTSEGLIGIGLALYALAQNLAKRKATGEKSKIEKIFTGTIGAVQVMKDTFVPEPGPERDAVNTFLANAEKEAVPDGDKITKAYKDKIIPKKAKILNLKGVKS